MSRDALVVGINNYQYLPVLQTAGQDAEAIAHRLQADGDFRVTRLPEVVQDGQSRVGSKTFVTLAELEAALVRLFKPKGGSVPHTALFYFSGHGLQKDAGIQEGFLATSDVNPSVGIYGLSLFWLRRLLQESPVRQRIILLDCCHSGELLNFLEADPGARSGTDRLFMAASREYEAAYESIAGPHSVFTTALLEGLDPQRLANGVVTNYALTDWVSNALKTEQQQPLFENSGSEIILTRGQTVPTVVKTRVVQEICPYRGLECFDEAYAEYFYGREDLTDQLIEKLRTNNFVAVVGASGSGKSSLIRAGLIYRLRQGQKFSGSDRWQIQLITPTDQPLKSLATAFINTKAPTIDRAEHLHRAEMLLREGDHGLAHLVRASLISSKPGRSDRLLLIIDQFEEVFTLCQGPQAERERHRFFNCLLTAQKEVGDSLSIILVMRADFFSKCSFYTNLAAQIEQNLITVTPLTYEQIKASILKPAEKVGLVCEPNLVYNILLDIVGAPGELPLLQYTLLELWQRRQPDPNGGPARLTLDAYNELGGVRGTLQKRADEVFYGLTPEEQQVAKRIFIALTQLGDGTEDTRRRVLKSEIVSPQFPIELVDKVLEKLVNAKLIVTNQLAGSTPRQEKADQDFANVSTALRFAQIMQGKSSRHPSKPTALPKPTEPAKPGYGDRLSGVTSRSSRPVEILQASAALSASQEIVDVAHETLIRHWPLLRSWLDENRDMLRRQRQIEHTAKEWDAADRPHSPEYLLRGSRLVDAEEFLDTYPAELSSLAQEFIQVSQEESRRSQKELRLVQMAVPFTLLVALAVTFNQYWTAVRSQEEKEDQLRIATSRQRAAIAQSILQDATADPETALLISRLAAEQGGRTYEAQASLRAALQKLQLQANLRGHQGTVYQLAFNPRQSLMATSGQDGTIRLWSLLDPSVGRVLHWTDPAIAGSNSADLANRPAPPAVTQIAFLPNGQQLVAIAQGERQARVWRLDSGKVQLNLEGATQPLIRLAVSSKGHWIAAASADNQVYIWRADNGRLQGRFSEVGPITALEFNSDGSGLLAASNNNVSLQPVNRFKNRRLLPHPKAVTSIDASPTGQYIATASQDGAVRLWDRSGHLKQTFPIGKTAQRKPGASVTVPLQQVLFSPDGTLLAAIDWQSHAWVWQVSSGQLLHQLDASAGLENTPRLAGQPRLAFSPDSQRLAMAVRTAGEQGPLDRVQVWDLPTGKLIGRLKGQAGGLEALQFSPDGTLLVTAGRDGSVRVWAVERGGEFPTLKMVGRKMQWAFLDQGVTAIAPDGTLQRWPLYPTPSLDPSADRSAPAPGGITGGSAPSGVRQTEQPVIERLTQLRWFRQPASPLERPSPLASRTLQGPAGQFAAQASSSRLMVNRKLLSGRSLTGVAFAPLSRQMVTVDNQGAMTLWQVQPDWTIKVLRRWQSPGGNASAPSSKKKPTQAGAAFRQLALSPDGQTLAITGADWTIQVWDVASEQVLRTLSGHQGPIQSLQLSADGQRLVSASQDQTIRVWQVSSGKQLSFWKQPAAVNRARFSPDGRMVVAALQDGTGRVMDARTGSLRVLLAGHRGPIRDVGFSPDGRMIATASADGTARLWDAQTGTEEASLRPDRPNEIEPLNQVIFSPDGQYLATMSDSGRLYLWAATWEGLIGLARDRTMGQLKPTDCLRYLRLPPNECPVVTAPP